MRNLVVESSSLINCCLVIHRWLIVGVIPLVTVIDTNGKANLISTNMVGQLQAINQIVTDVGDPAGCEYLSESIYAWGTGR